MKYSIGILIVCVAVMSGWRTTFAADQAADKAAIEKAVESYTAAFNARDAKSLAGQLVFRGGLRQPAHRRSGRR